MVIQSIDVYKYGVAIFQCKGTVTSIRGNVPRSLSYCLHVYSFTYDINGHKRATS